MRVEIELDDREVKALKEGTWTLSIGEKLHAALPRPIQVGDRVRIHDGERTCVVVAIHEGDAWVRRFSNFSGDEANAFVRVASLTLNEIGAAAALEKETDT